MILSREQIDGIAQHHRHDVDLGRWDADELDLIETARAYHDAMDEVERLRGVVNSSPSTALWAAGTLTIQNRALTAERDEARAELSALRDRIAALHVECTCCAPPTCNECTSLTYPCATVRLLEGDSDD